MLARRIVTLAAATVLTTTVAACGSGSSTSGSAESSAPTANASTSAMDHSSMPGMSGSPTQAGSGAASTGTSAGQSGDVMFAQMMIPHHEQAVEMADMALEKPDSSPAVRQLAAQIKSAQGPEIATMTGWLESWKAAVPNGSSGGMDHMNHGGMGGMTGMMSEADMTKLDAAEGKAFDRMWVTMMIAHHKGAVTMSEQVLKTTQNADVKQLATAIVNGQKAEITTMQKMV